MRYEYTFGTTCPNGHRGNEFIITLPKLNEFKARKIAIETHVIGKTCPRCDLPLILQKGGDVLDLKQLPDDFLPPQIR